MSDRVVEILARAEMRDKIESRLGEIEVRDVQVILIEENQVLIRALVEAGRLEDFASWVDSQTS